MSSIIYRQIGRDEKYKVWHKAKNNMFILIQCGNGSIVSRSKNYSMAKGMLCFIGKNKYHYTFPDDPEQYMRSKLFISSDELERISGILTSCGLLKNIPDENQIIAGFLDKRDFKEAEEIFEKLSAMQNDSTRFQAKAYSAIIELTVLLSKSTLEKIHSKSNNTQIAIEIAIEYVNRHITEDISLDGICAACHLSKYHFCRIFKQKIGVTVMEYILKTRIVMAKELLSESSMSITEISESCGFSSISYFSRTFKNEIGIPPLQYKKHCSIS